MTDTNWDPTQTPAFREAFGAYVLDQIRSHKTPVTETAIEIFTVAFDAGFEYGRNS